MEKIVGKYKGIAPGNKINKELLYAKIVSFRPILEKLVNKKESENLKNLLSTYNISEDISEDVKRRIDIMINNEILLEFDRYFDIKPLNIYNSPQNNELTTYEIGKD